MGKVLMTMLLMIDRMVGTVTEPIVTAAG
jgi:hypothetical protein